MATFYDLDEANSRLPELRGTLEALQRDRENLIDLRDRVVAVRTRDVRPERGGPASRDETSGESGDVLGAQSSDQGEARRIELRMRGIVDQMQAAVAQIDAWGITLRDIETGLVDFPALVAGRPVWLCWRLGEPAVAWWHEYTTGVAGRRRLEDLV